MSVDVQDTNIKFFINGSVEMTGGWIAVRRWLVVVDVRIPGYGPESESLKCRPWEQLLPPSRSSS